MEWRANYKPVKVNLAAKTDLELVQLQSHKNQWFARTARRLLHERAQTKGGVAKAATDKLLALSAKDSDATLRLNALWALYLTGGLKESRFNGPLNDRDPFVRAWAVQLAADTGALPSRLAAKYVAMAKSDASPVVRRYLASALQRLPEDRAWPLIEALAQHGEDKDDRNIPPLLWHGLATQWSSHPAKALDRALAVAERTQLPQLAEWIQWFTATQEGEALNGVVKSLKTLEGEALHRRLAGLWLAMEARANVPMPPAWPSVAPALYTARPPVQRLAERLAAAFADDTIFPRLRQTLADPKADKRERDHALAVLSRAQDRASFPVFLQLLDDAAFRSTAISLLSRFDTPEVSAALVQRFGMFKPTERSAALDVLTARPTYALALLDAVSAGRVGRDQLTAFHITRLVSLKNAEVDKRVNATWGRIHQTPAQKNMQIAKMEKIFNEAPLWAYSADAGQQHFQKLCLQCHRLGNEGARLGPELTGAGQHGVRYFLENIIDPDAVIGTDFQATTLEMKDGEALTGLLVGETGSAFTLRTTAGESVVPKTNVKQRSTAEKSLMPEGLLDALGERERIELLKFLTTH
jgi:putative heme-binding domain-containing protein